MAYTVKMVPGIKEKLLKVYEKCVDFEEKRESIERFEGLAGKEFGSLIEFIEQMPLHVKSPLGRCIKAASKEGYSEGLGSADLDLDAPPEERSKNIPEGYWSIGEINSLVLYMDTWRIGSIEKV